jgi:hypothetical protein
MVLIRLSWIVGRYRWIARSVSEGTEEDGTEVGWRSSEELAMERWEVSDSVEGMGCRSASLSSRSASDAIFS